MRIKKLLCAGLSAIMTFSVALGTAFSASAAGSATGVTGRYDEYDLKGRNPSDSPVKPILSVSKLEVPINIAKANPNQTIEITVSNASKKYSSIGFHVSFDSRLGIIPDFVDDNDSENDQMACWGPAGKGHGDTKRQDAHTFFTTAGWLPTKDNQDRGLNGVLISFVLTLPKDIEVGDVFPVEILYRKGDMFSSITQSEENSDLMDAWVFTNGIEQGYIKITEAVDLPDTQDSDEPVRSYGDLNGDGKIDSSDASLVLNYYSQLQVGAITLDDLPADLLKAGDINYDGLIDSKDATVILAYYSYISTGGTATLEEFVASQNT